nr:hypothetical protein [Tanacetum cinerariifolium]
MQIIRGNGGNQFRQYAGQNAENLNGYNAVQNVGNQNQIGNGNLVAARAEGNAVGQNGNQIRCYNCRGIGHYARNCTARPRRRDVAYLQTQLLIAQKEDAGIQLQAEEYDLMAAAADLDEIEKVNANCILMANLQQASSLGDVNDAMGSKKKTVVVASDPLALIARKTNVSKSKEKVVVSLDSEGSEADDFNDKKVEKKVDEKKRDISKVKCYNCKKEGHSAKDCKKTKVKDYEYYKTKMLLAKKDKDKQVLLAEDQAWMESSSDSDQEINANMVFMAQIEKVISDSEASSSSADENISEVPYYLSESKSESEFETSEYYDNSTNYGLFMNNDDDQEIFHDAIESAKKSDASEGFAQIIDFLSGSYINYALTVSPHIYISCIKQFWNTAVVKRMGDVTRLQALVDKTKIVISEDAIREILQLDDAEGVWKFLIHTILQSLSAKRTSWNEFSTAMASAVICLSKGQAQVVDLYSHTTRYISPALTQKVFANMRRVGKGCSGIETPLFENMLEIREIDAEEEVQILKLKARVKKLERLNKVKSSKLRRLKTVGTSQRIESSEDEENVFNQGRIGVDIHEGIELVDDQGKDVQVKGRQADTQAKIYNIKLDHTSKGVVIRDPEEELHDDTPAETQSAKDKGKGILVADPKPMKKKDQIAMDAEYARKLQEEEESLAQAKDA